MEKLSEYTTVCEKALRVGGDTIQAWAGQFDVRKKGPFDLVTQADLASQEAISQIIWGAFPDHAIIGEEDASLSVDANAHLRSSEYRWIVDPLDGTTNFVHGVPHYSVSLALERKGELFVIVSSGEVQRALTLIQMERVVSFAPTPEDALTRLRSSGTGVIQ